MRIVVRSKCSDIDELSKSYGVGINNIKRLNENINLKEGSLVLMDIADDIEHIVKPFETIESISKKYNISQKYLCEYNNISRVFLGDRVYIERDIASVSNDRN